MTQDIAKNALAFLARVELKGAEVMEFNKVAAALSAIANPVPKPPVTEEKVEKKEKK